MAYVPIEIKKRDTSSKSSVRILRDGIQAILLILRVIMLFNPLKIFIPVSVFLFIFGVIFSLYGVLLFGRMPNSGVLILVTSVILFFNGLLADQLSALRRER